MGPLSPGPTGCHLSLRMYLISLTFSFLCSLRLFQKFDTFRILVCGGDGSVGWVLSEIDSLNLHKQVLDCGRAQPRGVMPRSAAGQSRGLLLVPLEHCSPWGLRRSGRGEQAAR